ncbi:MAG TPA: translesion DNA synthesis-associated protein ImuA [Methylibium sp.]|uniref:translesion DNA synthesis-associated protein ImuA n=1 Tax=Methylibium sp. TaxID=2067992 RepID=UPI002DC03284|nr:translesion DNA synthesis-associated protein ImuA [Methylibium sp.]HEU4460789.1 translesion DNA synthesis-associated protein ImuA [Methylibium sp.]
MVSLSETDSAPDPHRRAGRLASSALALSQVAARLDVPVWQAGQLARSVVATESSGWPALDAELPGGGWPQAGLTELLIPAAGGELALLAPWLGTLAQRRLGPRELVWIASPASPTAPAMAALGLEAARLVFVAPASAADAAWAAEQALRAGSSAAVLWWSQSLGSPAPPVALPTWRRLHLAAQAGATPCFALREPAARNLSSPAPLRLACTPLENRRLAVEVFKRRGPPMAAPLELALPWPASVRRAARRPEVAAPSAVMATSTASTTTAPAPGREARCDGAAATGTASSVSLRSPRDAVDRAVPAAPAAAGA